MTLGEKIKTARKSLGMTQERLARDKITRNMISRIESGTASPSLDTMKYLAKELSLPIAYLLSDNDDLFFYEKNEKIELIYSAFKNSDYQYCIETITSFSRVDNELAYILTCSYFELGRNALLRGALRTALRNFEKADEYSLHTIFNTERTKTLTRMYRAIALNIQAPLLEFNSDEYEQGLFELFDYEMYRYLMQDYTYNYSESHFKAHATAKMLIKERRYSEAISPLRDAADYALKSDYNAYVVFAVYADLEYCYKQLYDFENAYRYSSKRMSMLEGFKT